MSRISTVKLPSSDTLVNNKRILVDVASFTFRFDSVDQLKECLAYYEKKIHPSSRISTKRLAQQLGEDWRELRGWDVERWFEKLPMYLLEEPKRQKVIKALRKALKQVGSKKGVSA